MPICSVGITLAAAFALQQPALQYYQVPGELHPTCWLLPAGAVGRVRGAVRVPGAGLGRGALPAAPARRVSLPAAGLSRTRIGRRPRRRRHARYGKEALHAEWTKLRTLASTGWLLLAAAALTIAVSAAADAAATCPSGGCQADPARLSLTGVQAGQAIVAIIAWPGAPCEAAESDPPQVPERPGMLSQLRTNGCSSANAQA